MGKKKRHYPCLFFRAPFFLKGVFFVAPFSALFFFLANIFFSKGLYFALFYTDFRLFPCFFLRKKIFALGPKIPYFFPGKSLGPTHSLDFGKFCIFFSIFFSGRNFSILAILIFFLRKSFKSTHSLKFSSQKKKYSTGKKIQHFHSLTRFFPESGKR